MPPSPPPLDIERAQAPNTEGGRRSTRLARGSVPQTPWGSDPDAEARRNRSQTQGGSDPDAEARRNRSQTQGGITSLITSIISPGAREGTLPVHEPTAGQAPPSYASAPPVRNTQPPPPPQQSRGSTSVPTATAATSSASEQLPGEASSAAPQQSRGSTSVPTVTAATSSASEQLPGEASSAAPQQSRGSTSVPSVAATWRIFTSSAPTSEQTQSDPVLQQQPLRTQHSVPSSLVGNDSLETRSQPPSLETTTQSPNMSQQAQSNTVTLQQVTARWEQVPEEDRNKLPSQLDRAVLEAVFRLAQPRLGTHRLNCASCNTPLSIARGYIRCGHAIHWDCIQQGGLDNGCPACATQRASLVRRPADSPNVRPAVRPEGDTDVNWTNGTWRNVTECQFCVSTLTSDDELRILSCNHTVHLACISMGALANGCPYCRHFDLTYGEWREHPNVTSRGPTLELGSVTSFGPLLESPIPLENASQPQEEPPQANEPTGRGSQTRNQERDRLLSELFHIHPDLWHLFTEEQRRLREIQNEANFDLDGWLNDFRTYHTVPGSNLSNILIRWHYSDYNTNLDIQDPRIREVESGRASAFYTIIRETISAFRGDEPGARVAFRQANQIRPQDSSNAFHPNFWLPHERMLSRANTVHERQSVRSHMRQYIRTFHNHPIMTALSVFEPTREDNGNGEPSGNGTTQVNDRGPQPDGTSTPRRSVEPRLYPRPGWVYHDGIEKEIRGYRPFASGFQVLLRIPAPQPGFWDHELVASHLVGSEITLNAYKAACEERGEEPFVFAESNIELLRYKTRSQVRILSRSVFRRYRYPPDGHLNAPMQHLEIEFTDEEGTFWYRKSRLEEKFTVPFVKSLLEGLYEASGLSPVSFSPSETRQRAPRTQPAAWQRTLPIRQRTNPTAQLPTNPTAQQPTNPTAQLPTNPTAQLPTNPTAQLPTNPTAQLPTNLTSLEGLSLESRFEARFARLEQMIAQLLARE